MYIATGHGIDQIDVMRSGNSIRLGRIRQYTTADGLATGVPGMAYRDRAGTLWFQGDSGLSKLQPEPNLSHPSPPLIQSLHIAGEALPMSDLGESTVSIPRLKPAQNNIQIEYSGLNFAPGETLRYQYMLEGADKAWSEPTLRRSVNYANLAAGHYRFLVRIADTEGRDRTPTSSVVFTIDPPLRRRWWFLALLAATIIAAGTALYRLRVRQLLELERVRTRIATDLHDDIGSNLAQIAILSEVALQNDSGGANDNALARIAEVSRETVHSISDIVWAVDPQHDRLSDLTNRMRRFANDVLGARNIKLCFLSSGEREIRIPPDVRREIFLIFKECVNNAARHSGCDAVDVEFTVEDSWLELRLADNGRGLDASVAPYGHGLTSMRRRIHGLGGEIEVASREPGGVSVHLRVPLPTESYMFR
jgi:signal transduction histidine kinase